MTTSVVQIHILGSSREHFGVPLLQEKKMKVSRKNKGQHCGVISGISPSPIRKPKYIILTKSVKLIFEFKMFLSVRQEVFLTLGKLFNFFEELLLCDRKVNKNS